MSFADDVEDCTDKIVQHARRKEDSRRVVEDLPGGRVLPVVKTTKVAAPLQQAPKVTEARERVAIVPSFEDAEKILGLASVAGKAKMLRRGRHTGMVAIHVSPKLSDRVRATIIIMSGRKSGTGHLCRRAAVVWKDGNVRDWSDSELKALRA